MNLICCFRVARLWGSFNGLIMKALLKAVRLMAAVFKVFPREIGGIAFADH
jgi:hypothetical protein